MNEYNVSGAKPAPDVLETSLPPASDPRRDLAAASFFATWTVVGWYAVSGDSYLWSDFGADPGPSLMPAIVLILLSVGSFTMLIGAVSKLRTAGAPREASGMFTSLLTPILFAVSLMVMIPLMRATGFVFAGALFAAGWTFVLHDRNRNLRLARRVFEAVAATSVGVGLIFYVFVRVIHVPLP